MITIKSVYTFIASLRGVKQLTLYNGRDEDFAKGFDPVSLSELRRLAAIFGNEALNKSSHPYISIRFAPMSNCQDLLIEIESTRYKNDMLMIRVHEWKDSHEFVPFVQKQDLSNDAQAILIPRS